MGDKKLVRERVASAIRFSCIVAIPSTVGLTVLAGPVNNFLFSGDNSLAIRMTIYGSLAVVFYSVSTVTNAILQASIKLRLPIFHAVISLVLHLIALDDHGSRIPHGNLQHGICEYPVRALHGLDEREINPEASRLPAGDERKR